MMRLAVLFCAAALLAQRKELPEFIAGDQCLFCHRNDIGPSWSKNRHNLTIRMKPGSETEFLLGAGAQQRILKKTGYGRFAIAEPGGAWNETKFAGRCAGCHTTAFNAGSKTFTEFAIDCYACHGVADLEHTNDTSLITLSKKKREPKMVTSICASCHLRGGRSKAKGFPFAYHFVPGDNLFADYSAELKKADDAAFNAGDRHVWRNVRDVMEGGSETTCLRCHAVHAGSADKHRRVLTSAACLDCHYESGPKKYLKQYKVTSAVCEY
jgi:hypothetical protein